MNKNLKTIVAATLTVLSLTLVGCSSEQNNDTTNENSTSQTENTAVTDYEKYLVDRYNNYFNNEEILKQYEVYNIYSNNFDYAGSYDEFIGGYNSFFASEKANLESFKKDIETNYKAGNPDVDKLNEQVMTSVNKSIMTMDEYGASFAEKTKDYATLSKDEVITGLKGLGEASNNARLELNKLINDAKARLGID